ncbi:MAG: exodeoxyribonuclease III [Chthoniobacterales bacterium]
MKFISWNVNGIRSVMGKGFQDFLKNEDADVICLQEVKAMRDQVDHSAWENNYEIHWNAADRKGYSGTAILTRKPTKSVSLGIGIPEHDAEGRVITVEYPDWYLVNVYTPNSKRELERLEYRTTIWDRLFLEYLQTLEKKKPVIFCGDLNVAHREIDIARPRENVRNAGFTPQERASFDRIVEAGFLDTFREFEKGGGHYTWWSYMGTARERNIGWRIDYFLISPALRPRLKEAFILPHVTGSDHCPVGIVFGK